MHIAIHCGGMPFNGETIPKGESLGGSESAAYYMAKELAALDHTVAVFTNSKVRGIWDGVRYEWMGEVSEQNPMGHLFQFVMQAPFDVVICQRHPHAFPRPFNSKINIWWLHDLALIRQRHAATGHLWNIDRVFTVSEFHKKQVADVYGIDPEYIHATKNGVDYSAFDGLEKFTREPNSLVFAARPERGLENLVEPGGIMEELKECTLYVCSYKNEPEHMRGFYRYLKSRCEALPNVKDMGHLGKRELYELMARCMLYVYPTTFEDTSCIAAIEANAAGTPFVGCDHAALPETIGGDGAVLVPLADGRVDKKAFVKAVRKLLKVPSLWEKLHRKAKEKRQTWQDAAKEWDAIFRDILAKKSAGKYRLYKHLERMSDIEAILADKGDEDKITEVESILPDFTKNYLFFLENDFRGHYERYYQYEKDRGVIYGPEDLTGNARFECIADLVKKTNPKKLLDFGCAHGHYCVNLAMRFPDIKITGYDLNASNIETAKEWVNNFKKNPSNTGPMPQFILGNETQVRGAYDMIIAAEVLEHVPDPPQTVVDLLAHLEPGGTLLISVPYGPWEAIGYKDHPGWRAHIHHFERRDLFEIFGYHKDYKLIALPHAPGLGHFVMTMTHTDEAVGSIDYGRKLSRQNPRQTLSACLIAKNEENIIGRTLSKIAPVCDEIIVGIDTTTTDNTRAVCDRHGARCIDIPSPIEIGFDAARNLTVKQAKMDWILWIDADETFENAHNLEKYLRDNHYSGYAVPQHHYAAEPAMVLKTDFPVRIFRNHKGVRFFGVVHEHPSAGHDCNAGVGKVMLIHDVSIMHTGYATETIRRARFWRNFPLMEKDRRTYPERNLGKMLYLRDLIHKIKYTLERNGNLMTAEIGEMCRAVIDLWRELLAQKEIRMTVEMIPFMSEAVNLTGGGIEFEYMLNAKLNNGASAPAAPIVGKYETRADIQALLAAIAEDQTKGFGEKYW